MEPPATGGDQVCDRLRNLKKLRSMRSDEVHPQVLREWAKEVVKLLSTVFEKPWG